ncbi:bifunctional tetrahydrofolate synthase/dihydrofolate synthase [Chromatium okenii]|uniref:Dihydrofolate synthase/folylpolyglutamate synthase n=1 Tax=Chromatium okenii TaxID=61644 RepID=A0A2S7XQ48_9GAMM|nr:bifunctional tetrahydrofolate synthase/dihydrofolate synthase [Chromatium okenii]PQJ95552.1 bifunctional tetrahydrofolate synthase/dihydrofolate synthase [Chromatium okenii]
MTIKRFNTLAAWLDWQITLHPQTIELGLARVAAVWARLCPTPLSFPVITVGGTNGKGSCVAMLEAIAQAADYRTVCYTSPHLLRYNERIRCNGEPASDDALCAAFAQIDAARGEIALTYFEFGTLAALVLALTEQPDLLVLEVGLGGRLDAVNVIDADVAVVTSIGRDHTEWLGETLDEIAVEKAGIFRAGCPAIIGQRDAPAALRDTALLQGAIVQQLGYEFDYAPGDNGWCWRGIGGERLSLPLPALRGGFQRNNAAAALVALRNLHEQRPISLNAIRLGLQRAQLPGRFQVFPGAPTWIFDVAHNGAAAVALASNLRDFACRGRVLAVFAVLADKEPEAIVESLLPFVDQWFLAQSDDARALPVNELASRVEGILREPAAGCFSTVDAALDAAETASGVADCVLVLGSFTTVSRALARHAAING